MHGESSRVQVSGFFKAIDARVLNCEQKGKFDGTKGGRRWWFKYLPSRSQLKPDFSGLFRLLFFSAPEIIRRGSRWGEVRYGYTTWQSLWLKGTPRIQERRSWYDASIRWMYYKLQHPVRSSQHLSGAQ